MQSVRLDLGALSHRGKVRETNEDAYVVCRTGRFVERLMGSVPDSVVPPRTEDIAHLLLIADGMGGMAAGEVASQTAIATFLQLLVQTPRWALRVDDPATREAEIRKMWNRARSYVAGVHAEVRRQADADPSLAGMGTTLTGAWTVGADLFVLHIGDSRAYLCRGGQVQRITRDHTLAQSYVDLGIMKEEEASTHRLSHVLTQAIGGPEADLQADFHGLHMAHDDRLLLCTDGLTNLVDEQEIAEILGVDGPSQEACRRLVDLGLDYGAPDNITAIVARYSIVVAP